MTGYVHPRDYQPATLPTDLAELLEIERLRVHVLKGIVAEQDAEISARETVIGELIAEAAAGL